MKRVLVSNLPMSCYVDAWIEIPDDVDPHGEGGNEFIAEAVCNGDFKVVAPPLTRSELELDGATVRDGWEFVIKAMTMEET